MGRHHPMCLACGTRTVRDLPSPIPDGTDVSFIEAMTGAAYYCSECFAALPESGGDR